jgi:hypothetical protein
LLSSPAGVRRSPMWLNRRDATEKGGFLKCPRCGYSKAGLSIRGSDRGQIRREGNNGLTGNTGEGAALLGFIR